MKPYDAETGSVWWFHHHGILDIFVVLDGYETDEHYGYECRRVFVLHSDDGNDEGYGTISTGSPYNETSRKFE